MIPALAERLDTTVEDLERRCVDYVDQWVANADNSLMACARDPGTIAALKQYLHDKPTRETQRGSIIYSVALAFGIDTGEALALCVHAGVIPEEKPE